MEITIKISDVVKEAFLDSLMLDPEIVDKLDFNKSTALITSIIKSYLNSSIDREDVDMLAIEYLDTISNSGELEEIMYDFNLVE